jgi:hypothetical protein
MQTPELFKMIANSLVFFLVLLALNSIATGLLVGGQMLLAKINVPKKDN